MRVDDLPNGFTGFSTQRSIGREQRLAAEPSSSLEPLRFDPEQLRDIPHQDRRCAWREVDLSAIRKNVSTIRQQVDRRCHFMAVVKAGGYGHGAVQVAKMALNSGADYLGVATIDEAIELREALINAPILVFSQPPMSAIPLFLAYKVMPTIYATDFAIQYGELADRYGVQAPYHLAVNTGMNRIGVEYADAVEFLNQVSFHRALELKGVFTHYATADMVETFDFQIQTKRFIEAINAIRAAGYNTGLVHAANSVATIKYPEVHFDMVRVGIAMYGLHPSQQTRTMVNLVPALSIRSCITDVRTVAMSEGVSYGLRYRSPGNVKICTLPLGYGDGLRRALSGNMGVLLGGQRHRQVGSICMDQCMFEVDLRVSGNRKRLDPQIGDEVVLIGQQGDKIITLDDMAHSLGTIHYELATGFSQRLPLVHLP